MKIQLLSDLHNEFYRAGTPPSIERTPADVVRLAGDIDVGLQGLQWARDQARRLGAPLLYVAGNHEFYHHDIALLDEMREFAVACDGVHFLENDEFILGDVRFLGCTLWTDYQATGDPAGAMQEARQSLSDHHVIGNGELLFMPEDALQRHLASRRWLEERLAKPYAGRTVVVTHHGPSLHCTHPVYPLNAFGCAFISDLAELVAQADVWCFGHTHANLDTMEQGCRLISNQRGYPGEGVEGFDPSGLIAVG
jgi:predicted phosphodiesterase